MKRIVIFLIIFLMSVTVNAKSKWFFGWFHFTPKVGIGSSTLINKSMFNIDRVTPDVFNLSYVYGGQLGVAFMDKYDVVFELNQNITNQFYSINMNNLGYDKSLKFKNLDYGVFFRYMAKTGYFEAGGMISNLNNIKIENTVVTDPATVPVFQDNTGYFNSQHYILVAGIGATVLQIDLFEITIGMRVNYGIQTFANGPELPLLDNVYSEVLKNNSISRSFSAMLEVEFHNFFGFFGKAICGSRSVIFFQKPKKLW